MSHAFLFHGGRVSEAARAYGGLPEDWLDLSTGLNPEPWPAARAGAGAVDWTALPDPDALAQLEAAAARHFGVAPNLCCAVPGSETALRLLARALDLPGRALVPAYRTHREAFYPSRPARFGEQPGAKEVFVLANPNNPDGALRDPEAIVEWAERIDASGGFLVVDEAFADCHPEASVARAVAPGLRLIVLRSFGKFFGLAGLRLGFVLGPPALMMLLRQLLGSWPVHAAALALGRAAYEDSHWIARTRAALPIRAEALDGVLRRHGLEPVGDCPLFRLVTGCEGQALFERLARARILVRPFAEFPDWVRFGVPADPAALARLDAALAGDRS
ncbi:aminotransferase class I/II-fold pyridoxal phosphate-dependent enzyme [Novosphingobium sp. TCA1]|uniref:aminotransferase class I/II-fold pyridoxal phosphate-dependent enzyme n=1 Tax=Novosphingobium sp. TCA1 TaxID=2682474 RepID=UPI0013061E2B|nr:aminotransferase class I/II-fold pyridoxal phosphate-dependent enzyme [Novosphingobium sp. TCA1]GFE76289.1 threonine-phosphate decarboxylase [Novosphingobium sp. TCA1]